MADQPVTREKLIKADIDVDNLGKAANEKVVINPRYGDPYKSAPLVIEEMQTKADQMVAQGFYKGYTTEALLLADKPVVAEMRARADDTRKIYRWNRTSAEGVTPIAGGWIDTGLSELDQAKNYTDEKTEIIEDKINQAFSQNNSEPLLQVHDSEFNLVAEIDQNAHLYLPGLSDSVQNEINEQKKVSLNTSMIGSLSHVMTDDDDNVVLGVELDGGLHVVGMQASVQEKLGVKSLVPPIKLYTPYHNLSDEAKDCVLSTMVSSKQMAPVPFNMLPHDFAISDDFINQLSLTIDPGYVPVDTTYSKDDQLVHPYIIEFRGGFRGYRYLMCITPLLIEEQENPHILGSRDLTSWELLTGFEQPIANPTPDRFLSDNGFTYDPVNGMLIVFWRNTEIGTNLDSKFFYKATYDGVEWTEAQLMMSPTGDSLLSPAILFDPRDNLWHLWTGKVEGTLMHFTAKHLNDAWELQSTTPFSGLWHFEVKYVGDKYVMLADVRVNPHNYVLAVSTDGNTWTRGNGLFKDGVNESYYKPTFITDYSENTINFNVFFTVHNPSQPENLARKRKLLRARTNSITIV